MKLGSSSDSDADPQGLDAPDLHHTHIFLDCRVLLRVMAWFRVCQVCSFNFRYFQLAANLRFGGSGVGIEVNM